MIVVAKAIWLGPLKMMMHAYELKEVAKLK